MGSIRFALSRTDTVSEFENDMSAIFSNWMGTHRQDLLRYCHMLTGSKWEGDDLAQDTWMKVWLSIQSKGNELKLSRAYLYRIARNTWIDRGRKKSVLLDLSPLEEVVEPIIDHDIMLSAMETLVEQLVPYQRSVLLLVDVFQYTAAEAAELLQTTEGAVKAALHRARMKMKSRINDSELNSKHSASRVKNDSDDMLVYAYVEAIRQQNIPALIMLLNNTTSRDLVPVLTLLSSSHKPLVKANSRSVDKVQPHPRRSELKYTSLYTCAA